MSLTSICAGFRRDGVGAVSYLETTIPDGYIPASVGENGEVVTEALPKSAEQQRLDALEQQMDALIGAETEE